MEDFTQRFFSFETECIYVTQASLKPMISLSYPPKIWDCRSTLLCLTSVEDLICISTEKELDAICF